MFFWSKICWVLNASLDTRPLSMITKHSDHLPMPKKKYGYVSFLVTDQQNTECTVTIIAIHHYKRKS